MSAAIAPLILVVVGVSGCAPANIGILSDVPPPQSLIDQDIDGPWAYIVDGALYLGLASSSSCPAVPTSIGAAEGELTVTVDRGFALWCTADLQLAVYELPVGDVPETVMLVNGDTRTRLEVARE